jgi:hypothetical protein
VTLVKKRFGEIASRRFVGPDGGGFKPIRGVPPSPGCCAASAPRELRADLKTASCVTRARARVAEGEGFVRRRDFVAMAGSHRASDAIPPKLALNSNASERGWRRERDSNPRNRFRFSGFQDHRHRPLGHPSASKQA